MNSHQEPDDAAPPRNYYRVWYQNNKERLRAKARAKYHENKEHMQIKRRMEYQKTGRTRYQERRKALGKTLREPTVLKEPKAPRPKYPDLRRASSTIEYNRAYHAARKYGVSLDQYRTLIKMPCEICGKKSNCLDHDHKTGKFRSVLCKPCNFGIGHLNDDVGLLEKAIVYLRKSPQ